MKFQKNEVLRVKRNADLPDVSLHLRGQLVEAKAVYQSSTLVHHAGPPPKNWVLENSRLERKD